MTKLEELEQKLNECQKELAELKESKKEGKWEPALREEYWFRDVYGNFDWCKNGDQENIDWQYKNIPIFKTKSECERYWHFMDTVKEKSYEFSKEEWEDTYVKKYVINYSFYDKEFSIDNYCSLKKIGTTYFKDEKSAQYIIDNFKDELMEFWI